MSILVQSLSKTYHVPKKQKGFWKELAAIVVQKQEQKVALEGVSFNIDEGELIGYIGPNGAGKSTTVKILSGILVPDSGEVKVLGKTPWQSRMEIVRQIGVVFGQRTQLWWDLQVIESFELLKEIYGVSDSSYKKILAELVDRLDLSQLLYIPVRMLSLGQRMRCDLAASLLHSPKIVFLDEPTIGLDAVSKLSLRDFIRQMNREQKVTILLTTHDMDDVEALCRRVIILSEGKTDFDGSLDNLRRKVLPERRLVIDLQKADEMIQEENIEVIKREGHRVWLRFNPTVVKPPEAIARITAKHAVVDLFIENPPIEETIAKLYGEAGR